MAPPEPRLPVRKRRASLPACGAPQPWPRSRTSHPSGPRPREHPTEVKALPQRNVHPTRTHTVLFTTRARGVQVESPFLGEPPKVYVVPHLKSLEEADLRDPWGFGKGPSAWKAGPSVAR